MKISIIHVSIAAACLLLGAQMAQAASPTATTTMPVSVFLASGCSVSATDLAFGNLNGTATTDATNTVTVNCSNTTPYEVGLSHPATPACGSSHCMQSGANAIGYDVFSDAARTTQWLDIGSGSDVTGTATGAAQVYTVYGTASAFGANPGGAYADTVTVTVQY